MTKEIKITQGKVALVDDEDYEELYKYKWYALLNRKTWYAGRTESYANGKRHNLVMHREILGLVRDDGKLTDHRNRNGLDKRRSNLRIVDYVLSNRNRGGHKDNTSGYNGVYWHKRTGKWVARIQINCKQINLGYYDNINDAIEARRKAELEYW